MGFVKFTALLVFNSELSSRRHRAKMSYDSEGVIKKKIITCTFFFYLRSQRSWLGNAVDLSKVRIAKRKIFLSCRSGSLDGETHE